jgi:hydroxyacylglutathione hydrolase
MPFEIIPVNLRHTNKPVSNCYLIKIDDGFILIDTSGCNVFNMDKSAIRNALERELESAGCKPGNLKLIILTGGGVDFTGNCAYISKKYRAKTAMHAGDREAVENPKLPEMKSGSILLKFFMVFLGPKLKKMYAEFERFSPDIVINEGFDLSQYGFDATIINIPGHSKGAIGIITSDGNLFTGDTIANRKGKPARHTIAENYDDLNSSIERIKKLNVKTVYPGYGLPFPMELFIKNDR